jgi:hypothetical protein
MPGVMNLSPGFGLLAVVFGRGLCDIFSGACIPQRVGIPEGG